MPKERLPVLSNNPKDNQVKLADKSIVEYKLSSSKVPVTLPSRKLLKPSLENPLAMVDNWPSNSLGTGNPFIAKLSRSFSFQLDEASSHSQFIVKPKFLENLEAYAHDELKLIENMYPTKDMPYVMSALQIYREVFDCIIADFRTYRPLLASIKAWYDRALHALNDEVKKMEPLKEMLVVVSEQCEDRIREVREKERTDIVVLHSQNRGLLEKMDDVRNEKATLEHHVLSLKEELAKAYHLYRDEVDARKLLIQDLNELRYQQEDLIEAQKKREAELAQQKGAETQDKRRNEDPTLLRLALKKAREQEDALCKQLNEMVANYSDVIPRRDFTTLQQKFIVVEDELARLKIDFDSLHKEHIALLEVHQKVVKQRDSYLNEAEALKRTATPRPILLRYKIFRPDWSKCSDVIIGGEERWSTLAGSRSSNELLDVLLKELVYGSDDLNQEFEGLGLADNIPPHLRCEGKVRRRQLQKRDCLIIITEVLNNKYAAEAKVDASLRTDLSDFLADYLRQNFGNEKLRNEWAYNLHDSWQRLAPHDPNIGYFFDLLNGEADEEIFHQKKKLVERLLQYLTQCDDQMGSKGTISAEVLQLALGQFFPMKTSGQLQRLVQAAIDDEQLTVNRKFERQRQTAVAADGEGDGQSPLGGDGGSQDKPLLKTLAWAQIKLNYRDMFRESDDAKVGGFLMELFKQEIDQRVAFAQEVISKLTKEVSEVRPDQLTMAFKSADPNADEGQVRRWVSFVYDITADEPASPIDRIELQKKLSKTAIRKRPIVPSS